MDGTLTVDPSLEGRLDSTIESADPGINPELYIGGAVKTALTVSGQPGSRQAERVLEIAEEALGLFLRKNRGYGEPDGDDLGAKGQFADMHRKWKRIRKHLWDGQPWEGEESFDEVLMDFIGHLLLTIDFDRQGRTA